MKKLGLSGMLLLAGVTAASAGFAIFMAAQVVSCGGGGVFVTSASSCSDILTTSGGDPLTP